MTQSVTPSNNTETLSITEQHNAHSCECLLWTNSEEVVFVVLLFPLSCFCISW